MSTSECWMLMLLLMSIWHFKLIKVEVSKIYVFYLCICMQIMMWETNYAIVNENHIMFEVIMDFSL